MTQPVTRRRKRSDLADWAEPETDLTNHVAAGVSPLRIHDLRHTAVALWIAAGASPKEIAVRAGHRSVVTVLDRYGHLLPGTEEKVTDALEVMLQQGASNTARVLRMQPRAKQTAP